MTKFNKHKLLVLAAAFLFFLMLTTVFGWYASRHQQPTARQPVTVCGQPEKINK